MSNKVIPVVTAIAFTTCTYPATPAERSFRGETSDHYAAKHIALFLLNLEIDFNMYHFGPEWNFAFRVPEGTAPTVERFLSTLPGSRPSTGQPVRPFFYAGADAGRLDLADLHNAVAQVTSHDDTQYLADLWNAFAPGSKADVTEINPAPIPAPSTSVSQSA